MAVEIIQRLAVEIGANIKAFTQKMARVVQATKKTGGGFSKLGTRLKSVTSAIRSTAGKFRKSIVSMKGAILGLVTGLVLKKVKDFISTVVNLGDQMAKTAKKVGVGVETLSGLKFAADLAGTSFEAVTGGFRRLSSAAFDANAGLAESKRAFEALGIEVTDSEGNLRALEDLFFDAADGLAALSSDTERAALAQDLFGRAGLDLIPLLKQGSKEIRKQIALAKELGITFSVKDARAAEEFKDQLTILRAALFGFASGIVKQVVPAFTEFFKVLTTSFRSTAKEGGDFTTSLSNFIKGLLFTTIGAIELMKSAWNGLKLIWLFIQATFKTLQVAFVSGFILILSKLRDFIEKFSGAFDAGFKAVVKGFGLFASLLVKGFTLLLTELLVLVAQNLFRIAKLAQKLPIKKAKQFAQTLRDLGTSAGLASVKVRQMGEKAQEALGKLKFLTAKTAAEGLNTAISKLGDTNDVLRVKLQAMKEELDGLAESEAIPFWERAKQKIIELNAAMLENEARAAAAAEKNKEAAAAQVTAAEKMRAAFSKLGENTRNIFKKMGQFVDSFATGFGQSISRALIFGENFKESMVSFFKDLASRIIQELVRILLTAIALSIALSFIPGFGPAVGFGEILKGVAIQGQGFFEFLGGGGGGTEMAHGGIVTRPTMALIGEAGPEAVIPLSRGGGGMGMQTIQIMLDGDMIAETVVERLPEIVRINAGLEI